MGATQRITDSLALDGHGELAGSATAAQMPQIPAKWVKFKALRGNSGNVYIGLANTVTVADGTTDVTTGWELGPGEETDWLPVPSGAIDSFYRICDNAGDDLVYFTMK